jgi:hypothetical protein
MMQENDVAKLQAHCGNLQDKLTRIRMGVTGLFDALAPHRAELPSEVQAMLGDFAQGFIATLEEGQLVDSAIWQAPQEKPN